MSGTLETRVEALEHEVSGMKAMLGGRQPGKDWRATFGMSRNDPDFDELVRLARDIRNQQTTLLSRNMVDFAQVPSLSVEDWTLPES